MKIYRTYYRCSICHSKIIFEVNVFENNLSNKVKQTCPKHGEVKRIYYCRHDYWYAKLFLTVRDIWRKIIK